MNIYYHATPLLLVPVISYYESIDDYIGAPQSSEGEPLRNNGPPAIHMPIEPPPQKSS